MECESCRGGASSSNNQPCVVCSARNTDEGGASTAAVPGSGSSENDDDAVRAAPIWAMVSILETRKGQQPKVLCIGCGKDFVGGVTRIRAHKLGGVKNGGVAACRKATDEEKKACKNYVEVKVAAVEKKNEQRLAVDEAKAAISAAAVSAANKQGSITRSFAKINHAELSSLVCQFFVSNGIPFHVADSESFKDVFKAVATVGSSFKLPSAWQLSNTLLDREYEGVHARLKVCYCHGFCEYLLLQQFLSL